MSERRPKSAFIKTLHHLADKEKRDLGLNLLQHYRVEQALQNTREMVPDVTRQDLYSIMKEEKMTPEERERARAATLQRIIKRTATMMDMNMDGGRRKRRRTSRKRKGKSKKRVKTSRKRSRSKSRKTRKRSLGKTRH